MDIKTSHLYKSKAADFRKISANMKKADINLDWQIREKDEISQKCKLAAKKAEQVAILSENISKYILDTIQRLERV